MGELASILQDFVNESLGILTGSGIEEILIQLGGTILLFIVVRKYFWKNITAFIDKRKAMMDDEIAAAENLKQEALEIKADADQEINQMKQAMAMTIEQNRKQAEKEKELMLNRAKQDAIRIKAEAEKQIEQDLLKARNELKHEIISVAKALAEKAIDSEMNDKTYDRLVDKATKEVYES